MAFSFYKNEYPVSFFCAVCKDIEAPKEFFCGILLMGVDPDENLIEIGESLEIFIRRMHSEGISVEDIHKKSEVQPELI